MYADHTTIRVSARNKAEVSRLLQDDLSKVNEWLCVNRLSLHVGNTSCMLVTTAQRIGHNLKKKKSLTSVKKQTKRAASIIPIINKIPKTPKSRFARDLNCHPRIHISDMLSQLTWLSVKQ